MSHKAALIQELTSLANKNGSRGKIIKQNHENYCPWAVELPILHANHQII